MSGADMQAIRNRWLQKRMAQKAKWENGFKPTKPNKKKKEKMNSKNYPLHPGQTHMEPQFMQIPLEEYETLKKAIETMAAELEELRKHELAWDLDKAKIKELEARQRWIKVSDELPTIGQEVIFLAKYKTEHIKKWLGDYRSFGGNFCVFYTSCPGLGCEFLPSEIIGWMPQPKTPENA